MSVIKNGNEAKDEDGLQVWVEAPEKMIYLSGPDWRLPTKKMGKQKNEDEKEEKSRVNDGEIKTK